MSEAILRRGFLRQLCTLPMLGGGVALLGAPTAVAEPVTPDLVDAYRRWLELEHYLLMEEMPKPSFIARAASRSIERLSAEGHYPDHDAIRRAEERVAKIETDFIARHCHFRARANLGATVFESPVDRYYLTPGMEIISPPASSRAALVMSAAGVNWRRA
jgi:hypothetical protein